MPGSVGACLVWLLVLLWVATRASAATTGPFSLLHSFFDPGSSAQPDTRQGSSVAIDGNVLAVGAPRDDTGANDAGVVNIYSATTGVLLHSLTNPRPAAGDFFGVSVAVSGTRVVVGALQDEAGVARAGSVFVYDLAGATPGVPMFALTNPIPALFAEFGCAVGISGTRIVVGARGDNWGADGAGRAFVFDVAGATPTAAVVTMNNPTPALYEGFGTAVAISGTRVVVGAWYDDGGGPVAGRAYVYELTDIMPGVPLLTLVNPEPWAAYNFGQAVAVSGGRVIVGTRSDEFGYLDLGKAYVYDATGSTPTTPQFTLLNPSPQYYEAFGISVGISGTRAIVGAMGAEIDWVRGGISYAYDLAGATPTEPTVTLANPNPGDDDRFGFAVAISGARAVVGAPLDDPGAEDAGSAWLYNVTGAEPDLPTGTFVNRSPTLEDFFGWSVGISGAYLAAGTPYADAGAPNAGSVSVYDWTGATPALPVATLVNPTPEAEDQFGTAVAISGTSLIVGAPRDNTLEPAAGSAYVYDLRDSASDTPVLTLYNPLPTTNGNFGASIAISGSRLVIGAPNNGTGTNLFGYAYVYDLAGNSPNTPAVILTNPTPISGEAFGTAVSISDSFVIVGAPNDDSGAPTAGSAYVYDLEQENPSAPVLTLNNPEPTTGDRFGSAVAISGTLVVVGAPWDDTLLRDAGSAYAYDLESSTPEIPVLTLNNPDPQRLDYFGNAVAIAGTRIVAGAYQDNLVAAAAGSAYVFNTAAATPEVPEAVFSKPAPAAYDQFGKSLALDATTVVIGAPFDDNSGANRGAVYLFSVHPTLAIEPDDPGFVRLSWAPANVPGFVLQYTDSLVPANWINAPSGASNPVILSTTNTARFYRLAPP